MAAFVPFGATFLSFSDYMRPSIRLAALSEAHVIYVFTHDSLALGEDGPTHQPVEHLASLRAMPNMMVIRPSDATETVEAWRVALAHTGGPVAIVLTRQKLPVLDRAAMAPAAGLAQGAYVLVESAGPAPELILIATGSEVALALDAHARLTGEGLASRVVSMPCWELFESQPQSYRDSVLPPAVRARVSVEAGVVVRLGTLRWPGRRERGRRPIRRIGSRTNGDARVGPDAGAGGRDRQTGAGARSREADQRSTPVESLAASRSTHQVTRPRADRSAAAG